MPRISNRNPRRRDMRMPPAETNKTVVTNRDDCCTTPETVAEEIYSGIEKKILFQNCCDSLYGCEQLDVRTRCNFWPKFAHPRWLTCRQLHDNKN